MRSAFALRIFSGRIIFISRLSRSAERSKRYFHGRGRGGKRHLQSAAFCESAALRGIVGSPSQSKPCGFASSPKGRALGIVEKFPAKL